jgi:hypothetical protein
MHIDLAGDCSSCHVSTSGGGTLRSGALGQTTSSSCADCHGSSDPNTAHHGSASAQSGNCVSCHTPDVGNGKTRANLAMPANLACAYCHMDWQVDVMGEPSSNDVVIYRMTFDPNGNPNSPPVYSEVHRITATGAAITIQDFAACFACHGATGVDNGRADAIGQADRVKPFHGVGAPYTGDDGNGAYGSFSNDIWAQYVNWGSEVRHPGHNAFNLLNTQIRSSKAQYNNTNNKVKWHDADGKGLHDVRDATYQNTVEIPWADYGGTVTGNIDITVGAPDGTTEVHNMATAVPTYP